MRFNRRDRIGWGRAGSVQDLLFMPSTVMLSQDYAGTSNTLHAENAEARRELRGELKSVGRSLFVLLRSFVLSAVK